MEKITQEQLNSLLRKHKLYLKGYECGKYLNLREADLSQTKGLLSAIDYLEENFEKTSDGYIVYKVFNLYHKMPSNWKIEKNFILKENVDNDRFNACSYGINIGTLKFIKNETVGITNEVYKLLIKYEWLAGVVVPYNTEGNIRCERAMIIEQVIE